MSVNLSPIAPRQAVSDADDPFKKYWWVILLGIAFTGIWLLMPMLGEKSVGSDSYQSAKPKVEENVEQSLSSADAGNGIDLSMEGTGRQRKEDGALGSSLYMAPDEPVPAAAAAGAAASATPGKASASLASALKKVSEGTGWDEKAQKGFKAPQLAGGSLSGMGAAGGGKAGSAAGGLGAFGSRNANVGFGSTRGLSGDVKEQQAPRANGMGALKATAGLAADAARNSSNDGARGALSQGFDGGKPGSKIGGGGSGGAVLSGGYAALDAAPINLKLDDPKLNGKEIKPPEKPETADAGESAADDEAMAQQLAMQMVGIVVGGMIGGPVGGIVTNAINKAVENQQAKTDAKEKEQLERHKQIDKS